MSCIKEIRRYATLAKEITEQDWSILGLKDSKCPNVAASSNLRITSERITSLLLIRLIILNSSSTTTRHSSSTSSSSVTSMSTTMNNLSTTNACKMILNGDDDVGRRLCFTNITETIINQLNDFVTSILSGYKDVKYHNFKHAYHVIISSNKLLDLVLTSDSNNNNKSSSVAVAAAVTTSNNNNNNNNNNNRFFGFQNDPLVHFALIFAALIHDVEHQGVPNKQLVLENDDLAIFYNEESVAEQRSLTIGFQTLLQPEYEELRSILFPPPGRQKDDATTSSSSSSRYHRFREIVTNLILATDIATPERGNIVKKRYENAFGDDTTTTTTTTTTGNTNTTSSQNKKIGKRSSKKKSRGVSSNQSNKSNNPNPLPSPRDNPIPSRRKRVLKDAAKRRRESSSVTTSTTTRTTPTSSSSFKSIKSKNSLDSWMELENETNWIEVGGGGGVGKSSKPSSEPIKKGSDHTHSSLFLWGWNNPTEDRKMEEPEDDDSDCESFAITEGSNESDTKKSKSSSGDDIYSKDSSTHNSQVPLDDDPFEASFSELVGDVLADFKLKAEKKSKAGKDDTERDDSENDDGAHLLLAKNTSIGQPLSVNYDDIPKSPSQSKKGIVDLKKIYGDLKSPRQGRKNKLDLKVMTSPRQGRKGKLDLKTIGLNIKSRSSEELKMSSLYRRNKGNSRRKSYGELGDNMEPFDTSNGKSSFDLTSESTSSSSFSKFKTFVSKRRSSLTFKRNNTLDEFGDHDSNLMASSELSSGLPNSSSLATPQTLSTRLAVSHDSSSNLCDKSIITMSTQDSTMTSTDDGDDTNDASIMALLEHILLVADVAHTMQGWDVMIKFAHNLSKEVQAAITAGRSGGVTDDPLDDWYTNQNSFMQFYILPLAKRLDKTACIAHSSIILEGFSLSEFVKLNMTRWEEQGHDVVTAWRRKRAKAEERAKKSKKDGRRTSKAGKGGMPKKPKKYAAENSASVLQRGESHLVSPRSSTKVLSC